MRKPYMTPKPRQRIRRNDEIFYFKKMTDRQVRDCPSWNECRDSGGMGIGAIEDMAQSAMGGKCWHECTCRPTWYLEMMNEQDGED